MQLIEGARVLGVHSIPVASEHRELQRREPTSADDVLWFATFSYRAFRHAKISKRPIRPYLPPICAAAVAEWRPSIRWPAVLIRVTSVARTARSTKVHVYTTSQQRFTEPYNSLLLSVVRAATVMFGSNRNGTLCQQNHECTGNGTDVDPFHQERQRSTSSIKLP